MVENFKEVLTSQSPHLKATSSPVDPYPLLALKTIEEVLHTHRVMQQSSNKRRRTPLGSLYAQSVLLHNGRTKSRRRKRAGSSNCWDTLYLLTWSSKDCLRHGILEQQSSRKHRSIVIVSESWVRSIVLQQLQKLCFDGQTSKAAFQKKQAKKEKGGSH